MPVKKRAAKTRRIELTQTHIAWLRSEPLDTDRHDVLIWFALDFDRGFPDPEPPGPRLWMKSGVTGATLWRQHADKIVAEHIAEWPGTRPERWWEFDAPRWPMGTWPGLWFDGALPACRRRLGGIGTPKYEALADVPSFTIGLPDSWVTSREVSYYSGRSIDIHGKPIGTAFAEGHFPYPAIDPNDPPLYESEAAFLDRLGLLMPGERRRLKARDFEPESVIDALGLDLDD